MKTERFLVHHAFVNHLKDNHLYGNYFEEDDGIDPEELNFEQSIILEEGPTRE